MVWHILLMGDDPVARRLLGIYLQARGARVVEADSVRAAVEHVESDPVDVLVADLSGAGRSGRRLLSQVRRLRCDLPVLLVTGSPAGPHDGAAAAGADAVLRKPVSLDRLAERIAAILEG